MPVAITPSHSTVLPDESRRLPHESRDPLAHESHAGRARRPHAGLTWLILAATTFTFMGCSGAGDSPAAQRGARAAHATGDIVVAVVWPWSAHGDTHFGDGLQLAIDEINGSGGIDGRHLRLVRYDDHESVNTGRDVAQQIAADPSVVAVIGHLQSYVTIPAAAIYDLAGLVLVAPTATDPTLTALGYSKVFRTTFSDRAVGQRMAELASTRGYRRVAITYIQDTYGRGLANAFEERAAQLGVTVVSRDSYDASETLTDQMLASTLRDWKGSSCDAIFLAGEVPSAATIVAEARRQGLHQPILGGDAMSSPALIDVARSAAEGVIVAAAFHPDEPRPEVRQFNRAYTARYGQIPDVGAALGYDAVTLLATAMRRAHSSVPADVARTLHGIDGWRGVTGPYAFDSAGNRLSMPIATTIVTNGRFALLADTNVTRVALVAP
jgi:branched-chain amino acid transport system substrate-binding protein